MKAQLLVNNVLKLLFYQVDLLDNLLAISTKMLSAINNGDVDKFCQHLDDREEIIKIIHEAYQRMIDQDLKHPSDQRTHIEIVKIDFQRVINQTMEINDKINQDITVLQNNLKAELAQAFTNRLKLARFHSQHSHGP